jgi:hypothetical protein
MIKHKYNTYQLQAIIIASRVADLELDIKAGRDHLRFKEIAEDLLAELQKLDMILYSKKQDGSEPYAKFRENIDWGHCRKYLHEVIKQENE